MLIPMLIIYRDTSMTKWQWSVQLRGFVDGQQVCETIEAGFHRDLRRAQYDGNFAHCKAVAKIYIPEPEEPDDAGKN